VNTETQDTGQIALLIAVGVRFYRQGLAELLAHQAGIMVQGVAANEAAAISQAQAVCPDVILLDTNLPESLITVRTLLQVAPRARVIALAVTEAEEEVISYAEAGISGYVTADASLEELTATIRSVASGQLLCPPRIAAALLRQVTRIAGGIGPDLERLTPRQLQIVKLIAEGLSNKEVAGYLNISVATVKNHVHQILDKLGAKRRGQAAARIRLAFPPSGIQFTPPPNRDRI
jgi:two-component system nitrate/nitrite response regulator NarL